MLDVVERSEISLDALEQTLLAGELMIGRIRAEQARALATLDRAQIHRVDGARTLTEWVAARVDVTSETARSLVEASKLLDEHLPSQRSLSAGEVSFDRALATARLVVTGADDDLVEASAGFDLSGVARLAARQRRITASRERLSYRERYLVMQPSLDDTSWRLWGRLPATDGRVVEAALVKRSEELPHPVGPASRSQRSADALVSIAFDALDGACGTPGGTAPVVSIFVDAALAAATNGEAGAEVAAGPRVGPATLEELLCEGAIGVIIKDELEPLAASGATRAIPPAIRKHVEWRDSGCVVAGCSSRYRLQPHHVIPYSEGGSHDAGNLATLCWYHHHVAVHGTGHRLDPESPPHNRRLLPPARGPD